MESGEQAESKIAVHDKTKMKNPNVNLLAATPIRNLQNYQLVDGLTPIEESAIRSLSSLPGSKGGSSMGSFEKLAIQLYFISSQGAMPTRIGIDPDLNNFRVGTAPYEYY